MDWHIDFDQWEFLRCVGNARFFSLCVVGSPSFLPRDFSRSIHYFNHFSSKWTSYIILSAYIVVFQLAYLESLWYFKTLCNIYCYWKFASWKFSSVFNISAVSCRQPVSNSKQINFILVPVFPLFLPPIKQSFRGDCTVSI